MAGLHRSDPRVKLLSFSRNFGHQVALTAGMDHATGDAVIVMDADLQHPPALIRTLLERWKEGFEIVHTVRGATADAGVFKNATGGVFYRLFRRLSGIDLPANAADFRLLDRSVVRAFGSIRERTREVAVLKTLGFTRQTILGLFVGEAVVLALVGGIAGSLVAMLIGAGAAKTGGFAGALKVEPVTMLIAWGAAACMGFFSALVPSYTASRLGIVEGLRHIG